MRKSRGGIYKTRADTYAALPDDANLRGTTTQAIRTIEVKGAFCRSHAEAMGRRATHLAARRDRKHGRLRALSIEFLKEGSVLFWRRQKLEEGRFFDESYIGFRFASP